ncbi:MAG TPA: ABC transporter permease [Candidatus Limnocylindria bacterium]
MPWAILLLVIALTVALYFLLYGTTQAQIAALQNGTASGGPQQTESQLRQQLLQLRPAAMMQFGLGIVGGVGAVVLIVLTASVFGSEFNWGTLRVILALGAGRERFLGAKYIAIALYALVLTAFGAIAAFASSEIVGRLASLDASLPENFGLRAAEAVATTTFTFLPYIALAAFIAVWAKSGSAGIAIGLIAYFAEGIVMSLLVAFNKDLAPIADFGLSRNATALNSLYDLPADTPGAGAQGAPLPDATHAAIVLLAYTVLFVGLALWRFRGRDVTSG